MEAVLFEQATSDARIIEEATCDNLGFTTLLHRSGGGLDDHTVNYMKCNHCGKHYVVTDFVNGRCDIRPMTDKEIQQHG